MKQTKIFLLTDASFLLFPSVAQAHSIGVYGLSSGLAHPSLGLDHLLTIISVGMISTRLKTGSPFLLPLSFACFMVLGGLIAISGINLPFVETGIAASVLISGMVIALAKRIPMAWAVGCVAFFAIFHGHAHGNELPDMTHPISYTCGFVLSTTLLLFFGIGIGVWTKKTLARQRIYRFSAGSLCL